MTLNLVKLCVGVESIDDLQSFVDRRTREQRRHGKPLHSWHITRMVPRRRDELLDGGSLYWVIKGNVQVRQQLLDIDVFRDAEGIRRCKLLLAPTLVATRWQPRRAFQGWRYLEAKDAPADLSQADADTMPARLKQELAELGLL